MVPIQSTFGLGDALFFVPFVVIAVVIFAFAGAVVYLEHRKEMALIESGHYDEVGRDSRAWILGGGLLVLALGLGSVVSALLSGGAVGDGVTAVFVGLAALAYYFYKRRTVGTTAA
ncbi:hypothetical protein C5B91_11675 [Haloferax sp. Atlit-10N]|uniref:Uncharacterized protein n=1 Tax=Haloferax prahovense (strain DSM 18310 / JCM 13924 / TL6) TaxID=1227461 RepID=M0G3W1_HALPT|nr:MULTISPECIES: hypothetical protein [Haloferax]ELZ66875.1 hypothetical protein C457_12599 [Haloferax prahovense DSM 18310]RDZ44183.1 hypothetical protein C5B87_08105 [Haloferax sp. Atlit-16N]RDZ47672.1 hypothetical protein C5B86_01035 [Haloferax sp. Atlit-19N]RDZ58228.1 hypothetical protein C5B91_11675 [Haloferax sp. Atlit-10N]